MKKDNSEIIGSDLVVINNVNNLPTIIPDIDKKELFNIIQDTEPIAQLVNKEFKINGIFPEFAEVPKKQIDDDVLDIDSQDVEMVERLRVTLLTDIGTYHSFSSTFHKALVKAINIFGDGFSLNVYTLSMKMRGGTGSGAKAYYVLKIV